jgi:hypothetical protein
MPAVSGYAAGVSWTIPTPFSTERANHKETVLSRSDLRALPGRISEQNLVWASSSVIERQHWDVTSDIVVEYEA